MSAFGHSVAPDPEEHCDICNGPCEVASEADRAEMSDADAALGRDLAKRVAEEQAEWDAEFKKRTGIAVGVALDTDEAMIERYIARRVEAGL